MHLRGRLTAALALTGLLFAIAICSHRVDAQTEPDALTPSSLDMSKASARYNNSRFHQFCIFNSSFSCSCSSLWDSGCNCDERDNGPTFAEAPCNCSSLCEELYQERRDLSPLTINQCHVPQVRQISVKIFISSYDPTSMSIVPYIQRLKEVMGGAIDLDVHYVVPLSELATGNRARYIADLLSRCAMALNPVQSVYLPFLTCMSFTKREHPDVSEVYNCSMLHPPNNWRSIRNCAQSGAGILLLRSDAQTALRYRVEGLPRIFMDERSFHAGPTASYEVYEAALCYVFANGARPFPWFIFYLMLAILVLVGLIIFTIKRWSTVPFIDNMQTIFMWNHRSATEEVDMLMYLRAYGIAEDEDEDAEEQIVEGERREEQNVELNLEADQNLSPGQRRRMRRQARRERRERRERRWQERANASASSTYSASGEAGEEGGESDEENEENGEISSENNNQFNQNRRNVTRNNNQNNQFNENSDQEGDDDEENSSLVRRSNRSNARARSEEDDYEEANIAAIRRASSSGSESNQARAPSSQYVHENLYEDMPDYYRSSSDEEDASKLD